MIEEPARVQVEPAVLERRFAWKRPALVRRKTPTTATQSPRVHPTTPSNAVRSSSRCQLLSVASRRINRSTNASISRSVFPKSTILPKNRSWIWFGWVWYTRPRWARLADALFSEPYSRNRGSRRCRRRRTDRSSWSSTVRTRTSGRSRRASPVTRTNGAIGTCTWCRSRFATFRTSPTIPLEIPFDLRRWRADGIIATFASRRIARLVHRSGIPVVGIEAEYGWCDPGWAVPYFATDNEGIGRLAAEHLLERGFKHLAFCGIPHTRLTGWSRDRQAAFARCAEHSGVPCSVFEEAVVSGRRNAKAIQRLSAWLDSLEKPVGLMASYDVRGRHVLTACRSLGLLVPEEIARDRCRQR